MKRILVTLVTVLVVFSFYSCENEDVQSGTDVEDVQGVEVSEAQIDAKWMVEGESDYLFFEFMADGHYLVSMNQDRAYFGLYTMLDTCTIELEGYGTLVSTAISADAFDFAVKLTGEDDYENITTGKKAKIASSLNTDKLCRLWQMTKFMNEDFSNQPFVVLFTDAGTYYIEYPFPIQGVTHVMNQWKWYDATETSIYYSWDFPVVWSADDYAEFTTLTADSLKIHEVEDGVVYDSELIPMD